MEQLVVYFSNAGVPQPWLNPTVNIAERNGTIRVTNWICKAVPNMSWFYYYNFDWYNSDKQYLFLFDWTASLANSDRYISGNNELDSYSFKQSWGRTVAATTPYDDSTMQKKLADIQQVISTPQEKIDLTIIENRLKSIEEKKIEIPEPIDLTQVHQKIDRVAKSIIPWITPEQVNEVIQQREDTKAINELIVTHKPQVDLEINAIKQLTEISNKQKKQGLLDKRAIMALSRNQK